MCGFESERLAPFVLREAYPACAPERSLWRHLKTSFSSAAKFMCSREPQHNTGLGFAAEKPSGSATDLLFFFLSSSLFLSLSTSLPFVLFSYIFRFFYSSPLAWLFWQCFKERGRTREDRREGSEEECVSVPGCVCERRRGVGRRRRRRE